MESFKSYVVTNNTHVDRYDPSYPAYPAYTRPIPGPQVGPADRKVGRFRESNGLPCPPERFPWPQSAWFRSIRDGYVAQARFGHGGRCSLPLRTPNTLKLRFLCNVKPGVDPRNLMNQAKPALTSGGWPHTFLLKYQRAHRRGLVGGTLFTKSRTFIDSLTHHFRLNK